VERTKPWGTSHAVLVAKDVINEPFAVINADDYYGAGSFQLIADFLTNDCSPSLMAMVGYTLHNTLSEYGTVNRGVCEVDNKNNFVQQFLFFQLPQLSCFYDLPHTLLY
jgi:UTP-glucose-1-phosphate uridylyltransferase